MVQLNPIEVGALKNRSLIRAVLAICQGRCRYWPSISKRCPVIAINYLLTTSTILSTRPNGGITRATSRLLMDRASVSSLRFFDRPFVATLVKQETGNSAMSTWLISPSAISVRGRFYHTERVNRAGPGLAGASRQDAKVWNGNWQVRWKDGQQQLQGIADNFVLQLTMTSRKPPVIHGNDGVSHKAAGVGHASHYISFTRLLTTGSIELNGKRYQVAGTSWDGSRIFHPPTRVRRKRGWDWLSLQLDDNTELMLYRLRHKDGSVDPFSSGTYIDAAGKSTYLGLSDFSMQPDGETYTSPATHATYPIRWKVAVPLLGLQLNITTTLPGQELVSSGGGSLSYWEGAIRIHGTLRGNVATGVGYLEMTGYSHRLTFEP